VHHYNSIQYCNTDSFYLYSPSSRRTSHLRCGQLEVRGYISICHNKNTQTAETMTRPIQCFAALSKNMFYKMQYLLRLLQCRPLLSDNMSCKNVHLPMLRRSEQNWCLRLIGDERSCDASAIQTVGAATWKLSRPSCVLVEGTSMSWRSDERRFARPENNKTTITQLLQHEQQHQQRL